MNIHEYKDKVRACWLGKNIGGSLGTPFECKRGVFDVDFYTHDYSKGALPNDDLDLQLVWLNAAEKYGKNLDSEILGEYWLSYIVADVSEYGMGKNNMEMGLLPPLSGWYNNPFRNSCGCFIRSELWACLAPGHPEIAVRYAYEDGIADHSEEGLYAEIFCAALQSAAFSESDIYTLLDIGVSYIPEGCLVAKAVTTAKDCFESGIDWKAARKRMMYEVPGSFAHALPGSAYMDEPIGPLGMNAPNNIGITILGLLYGKGNFSDSICIATGCGEDADCTAATLGALLGIINGTASIPKKWLDPIGDEIKTICVDLTKWETLDVPKTVTEFTDRICRLMPTFISEHIDLFNNNGPVISMEKGEGLKDKGVYKGRQGTDVNVRFTFRDKLKTQPFGVHRKSEPFDVTVDYINGISIKEGEPKKFGLKIENNIVKQQWLTVKWHLPEGWNMDPGAETCVNLSQRHGVTALTEVDYIMTPVQLQKGFYRIILEIKSNGRLSTMYLPITLVNGPDTRHWQGE
ncbi:MAG: ADP-ribosylglycohydrolase family protein [Clostridia bacterium]|nr:ADP-ribosylglycohydrolase family protein [Clostridia bacterium]MBN2883519.1 ADP-ribosylglycohydrolase family protein [Clostridia bacterium]